MKLPPGHYRLETITAYENSAQFRNAFNSVLTTLTTKVNAMSTSNNTSGRFWTAFGKLLDTFNYESKKNWSSLDAESKISLQNIIETKADSLNYDAEDYETYEDVGRDIDNALTIKSVSDNTSPTKPLSNTEQPKGYWESFGHLMDNRRVSYSNSATLSYMQEIISDEGNTYEIDVEDYATWSEAGKAIDKAILEESSGPFARLGKDLDEWLETEIVDSEIQSTIDNLKTAFEDLITYYGIKGTFDYEAAGKLIDESLKDTKPTKTRKK